MEGKINNVAEWGHPGTTARHFGVFLGLERAPGLLWRKRECLRGWKWRLRRPGKCGEGNWLVKLFGHSAAAATAATHKRAQRRSTAEVQRSKKTAFVG